VKKEIADEWVKELRSGKFKQGRGKLKRDDSYCCLGVLCEISKQEYKNDHGFLSYEIQTWAGMHTNTGYLKGLDTSLIRLNDGMVFTFDKIADIIEENWEQL